MVDLFQTIFDRCRWMEVFLYVGFNLLHDIFTDGDLCAVQAAGAFILSKAGPASGLPQ